MAVTFGSEVQIRLWVGLGSVSDRFGPIPIRALGCFGPFPFRSVHFGLDPFGLILGVGRFGPVWQVVSAHLILYRFLVNKKLFWLARLILCSFDRK